MRKSVILLIAILMSLAAGSAFADTRPFAPVQDGYVENVPLVQQWATDHLLVQFTTEGLQRANLPNPGDKAAGPAYRTGIASLDQAMDASSVTSLRVAYPAATNKTMAQDLGLNRWYIFEIAPGTDVRTVAKRMASDANVAAAQVDWVAFPAVAPNDPLYPDNWGHNNTAQLPDLDWGGSFSHTLPTTVGTPGFDTNAQAAWNAAQGYGDSGVVIAILDSGVDVGHPDLLQVTGWDFGDNDSNPDDNSADPGHGTAVSGVAAAIANNNLGVAGIAGGSSIMPLKVANNAGQMFFSAIDNAIIYAADNGADIISMSLGAAASSIPSTDAALDYAYNLGVTILAATGNENSSTISYPAIHDKVIGVGAASPCGDRKRSSSNSGEVSAGVSTDPNGYTCDGERWWGSSYGSTSQDNRGAVDIIAPTILPTTDIQGTGGYSTTDYSPFFNGTSCATPYAAGVCALIIANNPGFTPLQVRAQLVNTAEDVVSVESGAGWDRYTGYGMVDAAAAVGAVIPPAVQAAFTVVDSIGCAPFTVNFTDTSIGSPTAWSWNFGGIGLAFDQNPSFTFTDPGTYDVTLSITAPEGSNSLTKINFIVANSAPVAFFDKSAEIILAGESVAFTDTSSGNPTSWEWDFGDGFTSTDQNPTHFFETAGFFTVTLIVSSDCGSDTLTVPFAVIVTPPPAPVAAFSLSPNTGCAPLAVTFTDESTGSPTTWDWDFGDGATDTNASPSHSYLTAGVFDVTLIVTNAGGTDTLTVVSAVTVDGPPVVSWTVSDTTIPVGGTVTFTDTSSGAPTAWDWDFGDGGAATDQNPTHQFTVPGVYTVTMIASNACGPDTLAVVDQITVENQAGPVAAFSHTPSAGCAPLEVTFTDESLNNVSSWNWDFGDGGQDTQQNPVYTYNTPGTYDVRLIVSGTGGVDTMTVTGAVVVETAVTAAFTVSDTLSAPPLEVTFTDTSTGSPTSWLWDFGDATTDTVASPTHSYVADGMYDVTLIVSNACSADTLTMVAAVHINSLSAVGDLVPLHFGLESNYPNPFNPSTTFVFSLEQPGYARLEVFDVSGRRVATLVDGDKTSGRHEVLWQPKDLASGTYISRLSVGNKTATQLVTLLK